MINENIIDTILTVTVGICMFLSIYKAVVCKSRLWVLYGMFCGAFFLGSMWWVLYLLFFDGDNPISLIPYNDWNVANLFLLLLLELCLWEKRVARSERILWIIPLFVTVMCIYYMTMGKYISNIITAVMMGSVMWRACSGLLYMKRNPSEEDARLAGICHAVMFYFFTEYALWTASCLDYDNPLRNLYYVFTIGLALSIIRFIPALGKVVEG